VLLVILSDIFRFKNQKYILIFLISLNLISLGGYFYKIYLLHNNEALSFNVKLDKTPNIYLLMMESYTGNEAFKKVFNYDNREFENSLKKMGFNLYENFFSVAGSTKGSFYSLFTLKGKVSEEESNKVHGILEEKIHSVVLDILKKNDYQIYYAFGDEYLVHNQKHNLFLSKNSYMTRVRDHVPEELFPDIINMLPFQKRSPYLFVTKIGALHNAGTLRVGGVCHPVGPYIYSNDFQKYEDYKKIYINEVKKQNPYVISLIKEILKQDSNGIIIVLGDHGSQINNIFAQKKQQEIFSKFESCLMKYNVTAAIYWPSYLKDKIPLNIHYNNSIFYNIFKILGADLDLDVPVAENHCANQHLEKEK